ncbi:MAG: glycosyltransferase family 4 protein [Acidimicrobiales bacterium]
MIVENLCSLPLNPAASEVVAEVLAGRPAVLHHHDLAWQRPHLAHITGLPPDDPAWRHVTINELSRRQLGERGITARVIFNGFDVDAPLGKRDATRTALGIKTHERVVLHPVRAIERKGVPAALTLAEELDATYWLTGPAEEDYELMLSKLLATARVRVLHVPSPTNMADAYAAADVIAFPSTWEGFGNPLIEAAIHRRPLAVSSYPVAEEIRRLGFKWFEVDDAVTLEHFLDKANDSDVQAFHDHNTALARSHFSYDRLRQELGDLLSSMNFTPKVLL